MDHLSLGSIAIELGWDKCLKSVLSFFPFISILLIFPFSLLVQYTLFQIQSTAMPDICLSDEYSFWKTNGNFVKYKHTLTYLLNYLLTVALWIIKSKLISWFLFGEDLWGSCQCLCCLSAILEDASIDQTPKKSPWQLMHNHLSVHSSHWCFVDDPSIFVSPVNSLLSKMKIKEDRASHSSHKPSLVLPIQVHSMNGFTMAEYQEGLWNFTK